MRRSSAIRAVVCGLSASVLLTLVPASVSNAHAAEPNRLQRVGYFLQYGIYGRQYFVKNVATSGQAAALTTINYAYDGVDGAGNCSSVDTFADYERPVSADESVDGVADVFGQPLAGNFNQLRKLKQQFPQLRVL